MDLFGYAGAGRMAGSGGDRNNLHWLELWILCPLCIHLHLFCFFCFFCYHTYFEGFLFKYLCFLLIPRRSCSSSKLFCSREYTKNLILWLNPKPVHLSSPAVSLSTSCPSPLSNFTLSSSFLFSLSIHLIHIFDVWKRNVDTAKTRLFHL